jgi:hypothetical protein
VEQEVLLQTDGRSTRIRSRLGLRLAAITAIAGLAVAAAAATAAAQNVRPDATFVAFPDDPVAGQTVRFVSYGCDPDGRLIQQAWDLDGDGLFDDAFGASASRSFPAGSPTVGLRVTDNKGTVGVRRRTLDVAPGRAEYVLPRRTRTPLLSPFPIVRLSGSVSFIGTRVERLTVRSAPVCSRITVRCRGEGCPWRRSTKVMGRRPVRFRALERTLAAGVVLEVLVRKRDRIGKYTRFRLREGRGPARQDLCLRFEDRRGTPCPRD